MNFPKLGITYTSLLEVKGCYLIKVLIKVIKFSLWQMFKTGVIKPEFPAP